MQNELNAYLESKGVTTNLKHKRQLAKAFGLPMTTGTDEEESGLLRALKVGAMTTRGKIKESARIEFAFDELPVREFENVEMAEGVADAYSLPNGTALGISSRVVKVVTIYFTEKTILAK